MSRFRRLNRLMLRLWSDAEASYRQHILKVIPRESTATLLDVGCADGAWTDELRRAAAVPPEQVFGLEIVPELARRARERGFDVRAGDLEQPWPFENGAFDVVHANQVIEHVIRLDHFVSETRRVLKPGGLAVICTENLASWHNVVALLAGYQPFSLTNISSSGAIGNPLALHANEPGAAVPLQHVHVMTLTALRALFVAHGFRIEQGWGRGYHPFPEWIASRLAKIDPRHAHFIGLVARAKS